MTQPEKLVDQFIRRMMDSLANTNPEIRTAIDQKMTEQLAHDAPVTEGEAVIWLLGFGAKVYLATVPRERTGPAA